MWRGHLGRVPNKDVCYMIIKHESLTPYRQIALVLKRVFGNTHMGDMEKFYLIP